MNTLDAAFLGSKAFEVPKEESIQTTDNLMSTTPLGDWITHPEEIVHIQHDEALSEDTLNY